MADRIKPLMDCSLITHEVAVTEEDLRARLLAEVMAGLGLTAEDGKPRPGVTGRVLRGESRRGGYRVQVTRDMTKDTTPRLTKE